MIVERSWTEPNTNPLVTEVVKPFELKEPRDSKEMTHEEAMALLFGSQIEENGDKIVGILSRDDDEPYDYSGTVYKFNELIKLLEAAKVATQEPNGPNKAVDLIVYEALPVLSWIVQRLNEGVGLEFQWKQQSTTRAAIDDMFKSMRIDEIVDAVRNQLSSLPLDVVKDISRRGPAIHLGATGSTEGKKAVDSSARGEDETPEGVD